jgi:hypothetical protein
MKYFELADFFAVFGQTRILLGNPYTPIERSHKKNVFKKKSKTIDALVQNIQLDEHGKFRYYIMFATMDILIYVTCSLPEQKLNQISKI